MRLAFVCPECLTGFVVEMPDEPYAPNTLDGNHTGLRCGNHEPGTHHPWLVMVRDECRACGGKGAIGHECVPQMPRPDDPVDCLSCARTCPDQRDRRACSACRGSGRLVRDDGTVPLRAWRPLAPACEDGGGCPDCAAKACACHACAERPTCTSERQWRIACPIVAAATDAAEAAEPTPPDPPPVIDAAREVRARRSPWRFLARALDRAIHVMANVQGGTVRLRDAAADRVPQACCEGCGDEHGQYIPGDDTWSCRGCEVPF